jgi:hypothetical protein
MCPLLVVEDDPVDGSDTHHVSGLDTNVPPVAYIGTGDYAYKGAVTEGLSAFVTIGGAPLAVATSGSELRADGAMDHTAPKGGNYQPAGPAPNPATLTFVPPTGVGTGTPSTDAGSTLLTVNGEKALLDGDAFDTCGIPGGKESSTVTAQGQGFVTCSA